MFILQIYKAALYLQHERYSGLNFSTQLKKSKALAEPFIISNYTIRAISEYLFFCYSSPKQSLPTP